jgi:hypothetical protein
MSLPSPANSDTNLVDNKVASVSDEEYAIRFVIRRERRQRVGQYGG